MPDIVPDRELAALEAALKTLTPTACPLDRDQLFFRAGQASVRSRRWLWPAIASLLALTSGTLGALLAVRPGPEIVERLVYIQEPVKPVVPQPVVPDPPADSPRRQDVKPEDTMTSSPVDLPGDYLRLRQQVLRWGVEAIPAPMSLAGPGEPSRPISILDQFQLRN